MPLKIQQSSGGGEGYMGDGIFIDKATVKSVTDVTNDESANGGFKRDIALQVKLMLSKNDWERTITIGGNFARDNMNNSITDWGGAFRLRDFFLACGVEGELDENNRFSEELIRQTIGCDILILSYRNDNDKTSTWTQVASPDRDKEEFKQYFLSQVKKGYPKNYKAKKNSTSVDMSGPWDDNKSSVSADLL